MELEDWHRDHGEFILAALLWLSHSCPPQKVRCHYYAVAFLDEEHLAIVGMTRAVGMALYVYRLPCTIFDVRENRMHPAHYVFGLPTLSCPLHVLSERFKDTSPQHTPVLDPRPGRPARCSCPAVGG